MDAVGPALFPAHDDIERLPYYVLEDDDGAIGFFSFRAIDGQPFLHDLWVDAPRIGRGFGRILWHAAIAFAAHADYDPFSIESDPNAEAFYLAMGARRIGTRISPDSGRELPLLSYRRP